MTIQATDLKLLAAQRLTDDPDGGGRMTGTAIQDGAENNFWPDLSSVDRARGALQLRKGFAGPMTATADTFLGAHLVLEAAPEDEHIDATLVAASSHADERAELVAAIQGTLGTDGRTKRAFYGVRPLTAPAAAGAVQVQLDGIHSRVLPMAELGEPASGGLEIERSMPALFAAGPRQSILYVNGGDGLRFDTPILPGSLQFPSSAWADDDGRLEDGNGSSVLSLDYFRPRYTYPILTDPPVNGTYQPAFAIRLPAEALSLEVTEANQAAAYNFTLPHVSVPGSEIAVVVKADGTEFARIRSNGALSMSSAASGEAYNPADGVGSGAINRGTRVVSLAFSQKPPVGSTIRVSYARAGYLQELGSAALGNGGVFSGGEVAVTPSPGYQLAQARFSLPGMDFQVASDGTVTDLNGSVSGQYIGGKLLMVVEDGTAITDWVAVEIAEAFPVTTAQATLPAELKPGALTITGAWLDGAPFSATAGAGGAFSGGGISGQYTPATGRLQLSFATPVKQAGLAWSGERVSFVLAEGAAPGIDASKFPASGLVPVVRKSDLAVLHHTATTAPQVVANSGTIDVGRGSLAWLQVLGNDGTEILAGFTADLDAGIVTFTNVAGYSQPVRVRHRIEHMALISSVTEAGLVTLNLPLPQAFPAGSRLSTALLAGDLQARVGSPFSQQTWTAAWADARIGDPIAAAFNHAAFPITASNAGAVTERWAVIFQSSTTFRVIGERSGEVVANGSTAAVCAPVNPATGQPYFSIPPAGWGTGWAAGNVLRFPTTAAFIAFWLLRCTSPGAGGAADQILAALRGDIDA